MALFKEALSPRDHPGLGAMVPAGPQHLWHRHLHPDHPGRSAGQEGDHVRSLSDLIANDILAARGAAMITAAADRRHRLCRFAGRQAGPDPAANYRLHRLRGWLLLASLSVDVSGGLKIILIFAGFMLFNFMTNLGPNAQTYLLAGEVFPTAIRGKGAGFAAAFAKIGAVANRLLIPNSAGHDRHAVSALRPDRRLAAWGSGDVDVPHRDHRGESRPDWRGSERAGSQPACGRLMSHAPHFDAGEPVL